MSHPYLIEKPVMLCLVDVTLLELLVQCLDLFLHKLLGLLQLFWRKWCPYRCLRLFIFVNRFFIIINGFLDNRFCIIINSFLDNRFCIIINGFLSNLRWHLGSNFFNVLVRGLFLHICLFVWNLLDRFFCRFFQNLFFNLCFLERGFLLILFRHLLDGIFSGFFWNFFLNHIFLERFRRFLDRKILVFLFRDVLYYFFRRFFHL